VAWAAVNVPLGYVRKPVVLALQIPEGRSKLRMMTGRRQLA
jgi:hypothetical protein